MLRLKLQYFGHLMQRVTHWKRPWCWEELQAGEKGTIEDEKDGWHHRLDAHEFGWRLEVSDGQGGLAFCGSWGCKELDMTERLNWTDNTSVVFSKHYWTDSFLSFSGVSSDKESTCHWRRCKIHGFDPWVCKIPWRRKWQHTPVFLPGESRGQKNMAGHSPWSHQRVGHNLATKQQQILLN